MIRVFRPKSREINYPTWILQSGLTLNHTTMIDFTPSKTSKVKNIHLSRDHLLLILFCSSFIILFFFFPHYLIHQIFVHLRNFHFHNPLFTLSLILLTSLYFFSSSWRFHIYEFFINLTL